jgi:hypothetical protein
MAQSLKELQKKRDRADKLVELWHKELQKSARKIATYQRRSRLLTTLIEKRLAEKQQAPKDPTRVVEV